MGTCVKKIIKTVLFRAICLTVLSFLMTPSAFSREAGIIIKIKTDKENRIYNIGDNVSFEIAIKKDGQLVNEIEIGYTLALDGGKPYKEGKRKLVNGKATILANSLTKPGFLKLMVTFEYQGKSYREIAMVGFAPDKVLTTTTMPPDFISFWKKEIAKLSEIPIDPKLELLKEKSNELVNVYHVSFQNNEIGSRIYGILCVPKKEGKYPAVVRFPGAGLRPHFGNLELASKGVITLAIGIHGIPVNMDTTIYSALYKGTLKKYPHFNLESKDDYYFKRIYLGCIRALDFIYTLPKFDGTTLAVTGVSQGGALSIVTAALDPRVKSILVYCPALAELTGFFHNRAAGWPHLFNETNRKLSSTKEKVETAAYYDIVNFAKYVKAPGYYSWGFNDEITPPTSMYSMYNNISGSKILFIDPEVSHTVSTLQANNGNKWIEEILKIK